MVLDNPRWQRGKGMGSVIADGLTFLQAEHGLPAIMTLLFRPVVMLIREKEKDPFHTVAVFRKNLRGTATFQGEITIDAKLSEADIKDIKILRKHLDHFVRYKNFFPLDHNGQRVATGDGNDFVNVLFHLLERRRPMIPPPTLTVPIGIPHTVRVECGVFLNEIEILTSSGEVEVLQPFKNSIS